MRMDSKLLLDTKSFNNLPLVYPNTPNFSR